MNFNLNLSETYKEYLISRKESIYLGDEKVSYLFRFKNNYGASVIKGRGSCGSDLDLWELAIVKFSVDCNDYILDYYTGIAGDVIGCRNDAEIIELLERIKNL